jgi:hypothetical protein
MLIDGDVCAGKRTYAFLHNVFLRDALPAPSTTDNARCVLSSAVPHSSLLCFLNRINGSALNGVCRLL